MEKRGFKTSEALHYLGVSRRFFETHMYPLLKDKGVRAGTSVIYERSDLDDAWDAYKASLALERPAREGVAALQTAKKPAQHWHARAKSQKVKSAGEEGAFNSVVARILGRDKC